MLIDIKNHRIQSYEYGYIVSEKMIYEKGTKIGQTYYANTKYNGDLVQALRMVRDKEVKKVWEIQLSDLADMIAKIDEDFIQELKKLI